MVLLGSLQEAGSVPPVQGKVMPQQVARGETASQSPHGGERSSSGFSLTFYPGKTQDGFNSSQ